MTKYNTGNPVGSADPRDLHDNATVADRLVNGGADFYPDRLGVNRRSWASVQGEAEAFFETSGYEFVGDYAAGIELTRYSQVVRDTAGEFWRVSGSTELPYTTTGAGLPEGGAFVSVGDAALRQDLVQPVATYNNVADMKAGAGLGVGRKARTLGYYSPGDDGGNDYEIVAGATGTADGGSFIDLDNGLQAKGLFPAGIAYLEQFGVSATATSGENGAAYINALTHGGSTIRTHRGPYTFDFAGAGVKYVNTSLKLDLGAEKHTFLNYGGLVADSAVHIEYNGRIGCADTAFRSVIETSSAKSISIDTVELTDVLIPDGPIENSGIFFKIQSATDARFSLTCGTAIFRNLRNQSATMPMTGFGQFDSASTNAALHKYAFGNLTVENFYAVEVDNVTIQPGETDFFRLFSNPANVTINNLEVINCGKRFCKTQERVNFWVGNFKGVLDSRFTTSNFIATFEGQASNSGIATSFTIEQADIQYENLLRVFTASGLPHRFSLNNAEYKNISMYSASENAHITVKNVKGSGLTVQATASENVLIDGITDSSVGVIRASRSVLKNYDLSPSVGLAKFAFTNIELENGAFNNWRIDLSIATTLRMQDVDINYTVGGTADRAIRPVDGESVRVTGLKVNNATADTAVIFESPGGAGEMFIRDYRATGPVTFGFFSTGVWDFWLDNTDGNTINGAGVNTLKTATYA